MRLRGAGRAFCAGYDIGWGAEAMAAEADAGPWDPMADLRLMGSFVDVYTALWRSPKPVLAQVHGACVGGGTDLALCSDLIVCSEDCRIGYPPARVWGSPTTAMWTYRLGLERSKRLLLTGDALDGRRAVEWGLASEAVPEAELDAAALALRERMARLPANQLQMMKLLVNTTIEQLGLRTTQLVGTLLDGAARHTPEGVAFSRRGRGGRARGRRRPRRALRRLRAGTADGRCAPRREPASPPVGVAGGRGGAPPRRRQGRRRPRRAPAARVPARVLQRSVRDVAVVAKRAPSSRRWSPRCRSGSSPTSRSTRSPASSMRCAAPRAGRCSSVAVDLPLLDVALPRALAGSRRSSRRRRRAGRRAPAAPARALRAGRAAGARGRSTRPPRDRPRRGHRPARPRRRRRGAAPERQPPGGPPAGRRSSARAWDDARALVRWAPLA